MTLRKRSIGTPWTTMLKTACAVVGLAVGLAAGLAAGSVAGLAVGPSAGGGAVAAEQQAHVRLAANYSASGTHQCRASDGSTHTCIVTGLYFGNCIDAGSSLRTQDCCPSTRLCGRDAQGRETQCRLGGVSTGFAMNYCIPGF